MIILINNFLTRITRLNSKDHQLNAQKQFSFKANVRIRRRSWEEESREGFQWPIWLEIVSMVVSICHTSALTWAIAATLKLLSTCVDGATRPGRTVSKEKLSFPKAFFPALARPEWRRKFELARGPRQPSRKFLQFYDETYPLSFVLFYPLRHRAEAWSIRKRLQELRNRFRLSNSTTLTQ